MKEKNTIALDGICPFTASSNLQIEVTSYDLELDRYVIRYGSTEGFRCRNLIAPFHTFLMNIGKNDICWEVPKKDGSIETMLMKKNHIFFNPANLPISRSTADYYEFLLIFIDPEKMISSAKTPEKVFDFKELFNVNDPHLEHIFKLLLSEVQAENKNGGLFIESLISILSMHFIKNFTVSDSRLVNNIDGFTEEEHEKILLYIDENLNERLKLDRLAREMRTDTYNFTKKFKSSIGITPHQFIIQKKLERSKYLLRNFEYSLAEITYLLHFSDQSHFSNSFKKMYGVTPNKFRNSIAN